MRDLASYPVSYPYGATDPPYSPAHPHRGNDIAAPNLTPIIVVGTQIGLVGLTGRTTGYHCHIQEWQNDYANTRKPQNAFQSGTVTNIDPTGTQGDGSFGKFITIQSADGWNDSYCHLSEINVNVGQVIGDDMSTVGEVEFNDMYRAWFGPMENNPPTQDDRKRWVGAETNTVIRAMEADPRHSAWLAYIKDLQNAPAEALTPYSGPQLYTKKG